MKGASRTRKAIKYSSSHSHNCFPFFTQQSTKNWAESNISAFAPLQMSFVSSVVSSTDRHNVRLLDLFVHAFDGFI